MHNWNANRSTRLHRSNTTEYKEPSYEDYQVENIKWLSIQEFSVEAAGGKINEFIKVLKQGGMRNWNA